MLEHIRVVLPGRGEETGKSPRRTAGPAGTAGYRCRCRQGGSRQRILKRFPCGHQSAGFVAGRGQASEHGVFADSGGGGQPHWKQVWLEGDHRARSSGAIEKLGGRDKRTQHRAGGADLAKGVEPRARGASVVGPLNDRRVVVIHGVANPFRQAENCLGGAGVERGPRDAINAPAAGSLPANAAAGRIGQAGAIEQRPDHAAVAEAGKQLRQQCRSAARLLGIGDRHRADGIAPDSKAPLEGPQDLLRGALVEGLRIVAATHRGERTGSAALP